MDMSTAEKTSLDIFKSIMDWGPLSLYSANAKTRMPIGTIHRHIKLLEKTGKIKAYEFKTTGRKKIQVFTIKTKNLPHLFKIIFYYGLRIKNFKMNWKKKGLMLQVI
jgi:ribosome maturation protein Sdo1